MNHSSDSITAPVSEWRELPTYITRAYLLCAVVWSLPWSFAAVTGRWIPPKHDDAYRRNPDRERLRLRLLIESVPGTTQWAPPPREISVRLQVPIWLVSTLALWLLCVGV